jgi:acyl dehydratase
MSGKLLAPGHYFLEDIQAGDRIETGSLTVEERHIDSFAELTGDRFEIHMSEGRGKAWLSGACRARTVGSIACRWSEKPGGGAVCRRCVARLGLKFAGPVFPGDTIRVVMEIMTKRETRRPDRGILTIGFTVLNQRGETVQSGINTLMVLCRSAMREML